MDGFEEEALIDFKSRRERLSQREALAVDAVLDPIADVASGLASDALGVEYDPTIKQSWEVRGTRAALIAVRTYMTAQGVELEIRGE